VASAAGADHSVALQANGDVWSWGANESGQLGNGTTREQPNPERVGGGFVAIVAGDRHTVALKANGALWAWGSGLGGGHGSAAIEPSPIQIGSGFSAISAGGGHTLALKPDGSLWAWGYNRFGQVGNGSNIDQPVAVQIGMGFSAIDAGGSHSVALKPDGSLWTWGANFSGQLGQGQIDHQSRPLQIVTPIKFRAISAGGSNQFYFERGLGHTLAIDVDGRLWAWGYNGHGQLGNGKAQNQNTPVMVGTGFRAVYAGSRHSAAMRQDGSLLVWGAHESRPGGVGACDGQHDAGSCH
jgi:alpha-tubulin suppressor-like RCC1 family protein